MKALTFKVITNFLEAQKYWDMFSPKKALDDDWDFRYTYVKDFEFPFHFIVGFIEDIPIGLLPLELNTLKGLGPTLLQMTSPFLEFFGGIDTDNNRIFFKEGYETEDNINLFLQEIKEPAILTDLLYPYTTSSFQAEHTNDRFELDLKKFPNFEEFMSQNLDGKSRQRLINRLNKINNNYKVEIIPGDVVDLENLFQYSIDRFGETSSFNRPDRKEIYKNLLQNLPVDLTAIKLDGDTKAVAFCFNYKGVYTSGNIGYDFQIRDISKLLVVTQIKRAMELGCDVFDAGKGDNGWKEHFNLTKIPQYQLKLNLPEVDSLSSENLQA